MRNALIGIGIIWILISAAVPMLQSWELGSTVNSIGHEQIAELD